MSPAVFEFGNLFSASALLAIDNVPSKVFLGDPASVGAAAAAPEVGPIEISVRDTGGVSLLINEAAKAQNVSVAEARQTIINKMRDQAQSDGSPDVKQFVGPFSQFIETPGATLKIILSPKDSMTVMNALTSLNTDPKGLLTDFNFAIAVRQSQSAESK